MATFFTQRIVRRAPLAFPVKNALDDKSVDLARGGILRDLAYLRPFGRREISLEPVKKPVQHSALVCRQFVRCMRVPEFSLGKYRPEPHFRRPDGATVAT